MTVDSRERELLAQFLRVAVVGLDVDRALEEERFVQAVQLVLDGFGGSLGDRNLLGDCRLPRLPDLQHGFLEQPHVAWRRLQQRQFVCE
ncbi:MAG TPA: hypothetical protein VFK57_18470 [Vicinamibacterales bacterium]|nr:hypothetical protein [Vicinamibacterales bacterium]